MIAYEASVDTVVVHRVVDIDSTSETFSTKGDANAAMDPQAVPWSSVRGVVVASVPHLGGIMSAIILRKAHLIVAIAALNTLLCAVRKLIGNPVGN